MPARKLTPEQKERKRACERARRADPAVRENQRACQRARRADPAVRERIRAYNRAWRADPAGREWRQAYDRARLTNPAARKRKRLSERAWKAERYRTDPEFRARGARREKRRRNRTVEALAQRMGRDCFYCLCILDDPDVVITVDHVLAQSRGGSDDLDNLVLACLSCNSSKHDALIDDFLQRLTSRLRALNLTT